jgi:hypothetical protein
MRFKELLDGIGRKRRCRDTVAESLQQCSAARKLLVDRVCNRDQSLLLFLRDGSLQTALDEMQRRRGQHKGCEKDRPYDADTQAQLEVAAPDGPQKLRFSIHPGMQDVLHS